MSFFCSYVLGAYVLCFMILLPSIVGSWWYKSIRFNSDKILLSTSDMFQHLIFRSPTMQLERAYKLFKLVFIFLLLIFPIRKFQIVSKRFSIEKLVSFDCSFFE